MTDGRRRTAYRWAALLLWLGILFATLFPFQFRPHNDVTWVAGGGIRFGPHGIVVSEGPMTPETPGNDALCSMEILLKPASYNESRLILALFGKNQRVQLWVRQYLDGLILGRELPQGDARYRSIKRDVDHFFIPGQMMLLTLTSGMKGTSIYSNGKLLERFPGYTLSRQAMHGEIVLGTDPEHIDPWWGELRGLALYNVELSTGQVAEHYDTWSLGRALHWPEESDRTALFTFEEGQGTRMQNLCAGGADLTIPSSFQLPLKPFLARPWKEFSANWDYLNDLLRNILGFLPFGFALCGYLAAGGKGNRAVRITILAGALTSLGIEILQGYIPHRESGLTDVFTNTLGTALGAYLQQWQPFRALLQATPE